MAEPQLATDRNDDHIARENHARYVRARDAGHQKFIDHCIKVTKYYLGDQWDPADAQKLDEQGRPAITVNLMLSTINTAVGEFVNAQADIQYKPRRGPASEEVAAALTRLAMHICDDNNYESLEKEMIEDALLTGRGFLDVRPDFSDNILGEVRFRTLDPKSVIPDPTANSYDPKDWNEVFITQWLSLDEIAVLYGPEKAELLRYSNSAGVLFNDDTVRFEERDAFGDQLSLEHRHYETIEGGRTIKEVRVVDRQYYKLSRVREFVDPVNGDTRPVPESWSQEKIDLYTEAKNLTMRTRLVRRIRWTVTADCVTLFDGWSNDKTLTIVPLFCYFRRGKTAGMGKNLIGPQDVLNKTESQMLHVVNTTANSGYIVEAGGLANMTADELQQRGAETGVVIEMNPGKQIEKIKPNPVPTGLDNIAARSVNSFREISGVNSAMLGTEDAEVSGVALKSLQGRGSLQLATVRENLRRTRKILARKIVELVQYYYTEERVFYITGYDGDSEELVINQRDAAGRIANDLTVGEYDVVVGSMPARDNFEESQFAQAIELREIGVMVPDHRVIQYSGLHRKQELIEEVKQLTGFGEPTPEMQQMQEMQIQLLQAQVQQAMADVEKTLADSQYAKARAATEAQKPALEREQMQADMAITAEEQSVRLQVQRLKELSSQMQKILDANVKVRVAKQKEKDRPTPKGASNGRAKRR